MNKTEKFFIKCLNYSLNNKKIDSVPDDIDYKELLILAYRHAVMALLYYALENVIKDFPKVFQDSLKQSQYELVAQDVYAEYDVNQVITELEKAQIKFMPLKGYILKKIYPKSEMRYTSDCDILVEPKKFKIVHKIFKKLGYVAQRKDHHHDIYYHPITKTIFEIHKKLFVGALEKYFGIGFEKAISYNGSEYYYCYNENDFYISILAHCAYHFDESAGVGLRAICDIKVIKDKYYDKLDYEYIDKELEKCGLKTFKDEFEKVEKYLLEDFIDEEVSEYTKDLSKYILNSSMLTNDDLIDTNELVKTGKDFSKKAKRSVCFSKIFPSRDYIYNTFKWVNKFKFLLPIGYFLRWCRILILSPERIGKLHKINSVDEQSFNQVKNIKDGLGINGLMHKRSKRK